MTGELEPPLSSYFESTNAHDASAVADLFGETALVHDEGQDHLGRAAIRDWAQSTYDKYDVRLIPHDVHSDGEAMIVSSTVAGRFVGSPIDLKFRFVTDGDRIERLTIV
jgi:ketosteroid isomerase-like protein